VPATAKPSLPELQRWMRWVLTRPDGVEDALGSPKSLPENWSRGSEPRRWLSVIGETPEVSKATRLSIYGDGYFLRIVDVLGSVFESMKEVVGEHEFLHHIGREYLVKHPSTHRCIDNIGSEMADFLKDHHQTTHHHPYLADLARLEWAYHESFFADERPAFDFAALAGQPLGKWARATMDIDPSVRLLDLKWPVDELWRADGKWTRRRLKAMKQSPTKIIVYRRPDALVRVGRLDPAAFTLLSALKAGKTFGEALKTAARRNAAAPGMVMVWFREWSGLGILRGVDFR